MRFRVNFPVQKGNSNIAAEGIFKRSASRLLTVNGAEKRFSEPIRSKHIPGTLLSKQQQTVTFLGISNGTGDAFSDE